MSLDRFISAQDRVYADALAEIQAGCKMSHWMWFIWPQLRGLGRSGMAHHYGIEDLDEARAYAAHSVLGARLQEITRAMLAHAGEPPEAVLGSIDALKLRSSATLFREAADDSTLYDEILTAFFQGQPCQRTLDMMGQD